MLTFRALAAGALSEAAAYTAHLLEKTLPDEHLKLAEYYSRTQGVDEALANGMGALPTVRSDLDPRLAGVLGIEAGAVLSEKELGAILSGRRADARDIPGKSQPKKVTTKDGKERIKISGMDLCLSAPKSVSVAWAFAQTEAERQIILQAHRDARDETLRYVEQEIGGRIGAQGKQVAADAKMAWIAIDHFTARATIDITRPDPVTGVVGTELYTLAPNTPGDPQLHSHCIVPNVTVAADGRVVALNTMKFHGRKKEFGAVYQAFLAKNLRKAGIEVDLCDRTLMAKLSVIPESVCDEFSKRTGDASTAAREMAKASGKDWDKMPVHEKVTLLKGGAYRTRRAKADDLANFSAWFAQAETMGWTHQSAVTGEQHPAVDRLDKAFDTALPLLDGLFWQRAVIFGSEARLQAVRGLIKWGIETTKDIGVLTKRMVRDGVRQNGRHTGLRYTETAKGVKITTDLHIEQENELIELARAAASNKARALTGEEIEAAVERKGISFPGAHGEKQHEGMHRLGTGGEFSVLVGSAGAGKTTILGPLVEAWRSRGRRVFGLSLAWRQAQEMTGAGIDRFNVRALQNFLIGVRDGWTKVSASDVIVVDELGQVGTRQLLELLRLQKEHGFQIAAVGDDKQCTSIEAGAVIDLLRKALGDESIPEILTTIRQKTEREREIASKFREGKPEAVAEAISLKCEDGTAELCEGGYREAVDRIAELAMEHEGLTISAPTNADTLAIGRAIRARRQTTGEIGRDEITLPATDGTDTFDLQLAPGDRIRLFKPVRGIYEIEGRRKDARVGENGSVVEIVKIKDGGLDLRVQSGRVAFVPWSNLQDDDGKAMITLGDCLTIDSAQGLTSDFHIFAMPGGSKHVQAFKAYVASSRHRISSWLVTSKAEEMREIALRRPLGVTDPITDELIWENVAKNLARQDVKESATTMMERAAAAKVETVHTFQTSLRKIEARKRPRTRLRARVQEVTAVQHLAEAIGQAATQLGEMRKEPMRTRVRVSEHEARTQFIDFLRQAGFDLRSHEPVADGRWHNLPLLGQKGGDKSGGYVFHLDARPAGAIHNHKTGERRTWKANGGAEPISDEEHRRIVAERQAASDLRGRQTAERQAKAAARARSMFAKAKPADPNHPYLKRKEVGAHGIRQIGSNLVIPLVDPADGKIYNLQFITPSGLKRPLTGARKDGLSHVLGEAFDGEEIGIAEGYASSASVHEALGIPVAMAIDSGNLVPAARGIRRRYLNSTILIAGDQDAALPYRSPPLPNIGKVKAQEAAVAVRGEVSLPEAERSSVDWNDYAVEHGAQATKIALRRNRRKPEPSAAKTAKMTLA